MRLHIIFGGMPSKGRRFACTAVIFYCTYKTNVQLLARSANCIVWAFVVDTTLQHKICARQAKHKLGKSLRREDLQFGDTFGLG